MQLKWGANDANTDGGMVQGQLGRQNAIRKYRYKISTKITHLGRADQQFTGKNYATTADSATRADN